MRVLMNARVQHNQVCCHKCEQNFLPSFDADKQDDLFSRLCTWYVAKETRSVTCALVFPICKLDTSLDSTHGLHLEIQPGNAVPIDLTISLSNQFGEGPPLTSRPHVTSLF